jgi:hypothetical protein
MKILTHSLATVILLASYSALKSQDSDENPFKVYISFGQNIADNHSLAMTKSPWGGPGSYQAELGIEFLHTQSTLLVRPNVGYTRILSKSPKEGQTIGFTPPRSQTTGVTETPICDLLGVYIGFDLVYNVSKRLPLTVTAGPSFHTWSVELVNVLQGGQGERGMKLGWRTGLGYKFNEQCRVDFGYTMTEWRSNNLGLRPAGDLPVDKRESDYGPGYVHGFNPSLPSYFTLKVSYTF